MPLPSVTVIHPLSYIIPMRKGCFSMFFPRMWQRCAFRSVFRLAFVSAPPPISHMFMSGCSISEIEEGRRPAPLSRKLVTSADSVAVHLAELAVYNPRGPTRRRQFIFCVPTTSCFLSFRVLFACLIIMAVAQWTNCMLRYIIVCSKYFVRLGACEGICRGYVLARTNYPIRST